VDVGQINELDYGEEEYSSNDEDVDEEYDQYEVQYSSEEENGAAQMDRGGLEWDDDIGIKSCKKLHSVPSGLSKFV
jgi:hypothetical protein